MPFLSTLPSSCIFKSNFKSFWPVVLFIELFVKLNFNCNHPLVDYNKISTLKCYAKWIGKCWNGNGIGKRINFGHYPTKFHLAFIFNYNHSLYDYNKTSTFKWYGMVNGKMEMVIEYILNYCIPYVPYNSSFFVYFQDTFQDILNRVFLFCRFWKILL